MRERERESLGADLQFCNGVKAKKGAGSGEGKTRMLKYSFLAGNFRQLFIIFFI